MFMFFVIYQSSQCIEQTFNKCLKNLGHLKAIKLISNDQLVFKYSKLKTL